MGSTCKSQQSAEAMEELGEGDAGNAESSSKRQRTLKQVHCYLKYSAELPFPLSWDDPQIVALNDQLKSLYDTEVFVKAVTEWSEDTSSITVVICSVTDQIDADIEHALNGVINPAKVVLLLLHSVEPPQKVADTGILDRGLRAIVHVVYSPQSGFSDCETNKSALVELCDIFGIDWNEGQREVAARDRPVGPEAGQKAKWFVKKAAGSVEVFDEIKEKLRSEYKADLDILEVSEWPMGPSANTLVICPVTSRAGSNIDHALKGATDMERVVVLLLHPVEPHVKPPRRTMDALPDDKYSALRDIIDLVYTTKRGIYDCELNRWAFKRLSEILGQSVETEVLSESEVDAGGRLKWLTESARNAFSKVSNPFSGISNTISSPSKNKHDGSDAVGTSTATIKKAQWFLKQAKGSDSDCFQQVKERLLLECGNEAEISEVVAWPGDASAATLVVCPVTSRVGSNLDHALRGVCNMERVVVLLLHPVQPHVRPPRRTMDALPDDKYSALRDIIDLIYTPKHGIYNCELNRWAFKQLRDVLKQDCIEHNRKKKSQNSCGSDHCSTDEMDTEDTRVLVKFFVKGSMTGSDLKGGELCVFNTIKERLLSLSNAEMVTEWPDDTSSVTLVVCVVTGTVCSDANRALRGLINPTETALLLFHHRARGEDLPRKSRGTIQWEEEKLSQIGAVIDFVFNGVCDIYPCLTNTEAFDKLRNCLRDLSFAMVHSADM